MAFCTGCGKDVKEGDKFCGVCGKPVDSGPVVPPPLPSEQTTIQTPVLPTEDKKKAGPAKKGCLGCLGLIVILIVIGAIFGGGTSNNSKSSSPSSTSSTTQSKPQEPEYKYTCEVKGIGKVKGAIVSEVGAAIAEIQSVNAVETSFSRVQASGVFKVLYVVTSNFQKDAVTMDANLIKLIDDKGREFSHSIEAGTALEMKGRKTFFLNTVNPGNTYGGVIAFDVPKDANIVKMKFRGGMSGRDGEVPFRVMMAD